MLEPLHHLNLLSNRVSDLGPFSSQGVFAFYRQWPLDEDAKYSPLANTPATNLLSFRYNRGIGYYWRDLERSQIKGLLLGLWES